MNSPTVEELTRIYNLVNICITDVAPAAVFTKCLRDMFDAWVTSEVTDGLRSSERSEVLETYRHLEQLLSGIPQAA